MKFVLASRSAYTTEVSRTATWQLTFFPCAFKAAIAFATCPIAGRLELGSVAHTSNCEFPRYYAVAILVEMIVAARRLRRHFCAGQRCETSDRGNKVPFHDGFPLFTQRSLSLCSLVARIVVSVQTAMARHMPPCSRCKGWGSARGELQTRFAPEVLRWARKRAARPDDFYQVGCLICTMRRSRSQLLRGGMAVRCATFGAQPASRWDADGQESKLGELSSVVSASDATQSNSHGVGFDFVEELRVGFFVWIETPSASQNAGDDVSVERR